MKFSEIELPSNRKFGLFFAAVCAAIGGYFFFKGLQASALAVLAASIAFLVAALTRPTLLAPLNKAWMGLGFLLGLVISPIVLGVIFFLIFTPVGVVMRMVGRDELRTKMTRRDTYWKPRDPVGPDADSFKYQF